MASLHDLLAEEGFKHRSFMKGQKHMRVRRHKTGADEAVLLPIHICHDHKGFDSLKHQVEKSSTQKGSSIFSSRRVSSDVERSNAKSSLAGDEPAIDDAAIRAVISILSGYIGRYKNDVAFREMIREKCNSCCLLRSRDELDNEIIANMELGMESTEKLVEYEGTREELRMDSLRNSIQLLSIVASLNSKKSRNGSTCGIPNSHLSACAQLYLSIVYKLEKNDRISARHVLQVFCDSPFLARTHLLPDLWEHFFLPHLLHLKVWHQKELEFLSNSQYFEKEKRMKALAKVYNDQMDKGTIQFALYYKQWLKVGAKAPSIPDVPLPSRPTYPPSRRRSSDSHTSHSPINSHLYKTVFGPSAKSRSMDLDCPDRASVSTWEEDEDKLCLKEDEYKDCNYVPNKARSLQRPAREKFASPKDELWLDKQKSNYFRFLSCQRVVSECLVNGDRIVRNNSIRSPEITHLPLSDLSRAISTICSSDSLTQCENATRVITKAWLDSHGNPITENSLSKAPVIVGMLEVLFASNDDEILELAISILAELVARNESIRLIILNSDPQLEIFMRLLKSSSLFLKAAVLLYLLRPKAKQMISIEWVALVLRVLEFGDQFQTLFTVRCFPQKAAMYFLNQLLTGFDEDRNLENASQLISLGGLSLLVRSFEIGDIDERNNAALLMSCCIRADGSSRIYLSSNLNKASLLELIVLGIQKKASGCVFALITELLCLSRRKQILNFLTGINNGWGGLNTKHIFLVYLLRASPEERPLVAAILLQLDLLEEPLKSSVYREEAVDAIIESLDCQNSKIQEQTARALFMLGGRFSYTGEATAEEWLLQQAGVVHERFTDFFRSKNEEEEATEDWQRKVAVVLLNSGGTRFLTSLSNSIANGTPNLAQSCLFTVAWMNRILHSIQDENFNSREHSTHEPQLPESSKYTRNPDQAALPPFSLQRQIKSSACVSMLSLLDKELIDPLRKNPL